MSTAHSSTVRPEIAAITQTIIERSMASRQDYLSRMATAISEGPNRQVLSCGNLAHGFAACGMDDKKRLAGKQAPNLGIITAYNDMLSAHQPYAGYPDLIKRKAEELGAVAQVAGGVPAMCDGVTQGQPGMELSLFSRDSIALSASIGLSHNMFDAALYLGICDKIVPGLLIAALTFGHLPAVFVPAGPMPSGLPNKEKARVREEYAQGKVGKDDLLEAESKSYHSAGTCTFYGTANSNQALLEAMGLHVPSAAFAHPGTPLRDALTEEATRLAIDISGLGENFRPISQVIDERSIVNALVMLLATGGSTNHTIHWIAVARAAGILVTWDDMDALSKLTPLLTRVYPNGQADVNAMEEAGGLPFLIRELEQHGLMHGDVRTNMGQGLAHMHQRASLGNTGQLSFAPAAAKSSNLEVVRPASQPFQDDGGLRLLTGNLGRAVIKTSAVERERWIVEAPCAVFSDQDAALAAYKAGELHRDVVVVLRYQGPKANGMPELHKLTPALSVLQNLGFKVALVTDGRMSGASGKVPAAIHVTPEALDGGLIARLADGDVVRLDAEARSLSVLTDADTLAQRPLEKPAQMAQSGFGLGRELFAPFRAAVGPADQGASIFS